MGYVLYGQHAANDDDSEAVHLFCRGRAAMDDGDIEGALKLFQESVDLEPHYKSLQLMGDCLLRLSRFKEAIVPLAAAKGLNRQSAPALLLAKAFLGAGNLVHALSAAEEAVERLPHHKEAIALLKEIRDKHRIYFGREKGESPIEDEEKRE